MKIKKRYACALIVLLILIAGIFVVYAVVNKEEKGWHNPDEIIVEITAGCDVFLEDAISNEWLKGFDAPSSSDCLSEFPKTYHLASEILISTDSGEMTLQNALLNGIPLQKSSTTTSYSSTPSTSTYHFATEIEVTVDSVPMSLQEGIDTNAGEKFVCVPDCSCAATTCIGSTCTDTCGQTCPGTKIPDTCSSLGSTCGTPDDGCGGTLYCTISHASIGCIAIEGGDVYWFDSCGNVEELKEDCTTWFETVWGDFYCLTSDTRGRDWTSSRNACVDGTCSFVSSGSGTQSSSCESGTICESGVCIEEGKVISTELYHRDILDEETYKMDVTYAHQHFSPEALRGYQVWAIPVVKAMRKNPEAMEFIIPMVNSFMEEIAYRVGKKETGNEAGKLFLDEGVPLFERIGILINEPDWRSLFDENWLQERVDPIYINVFKFAIGDNFFSIEDIIRKLLQNNKDDKYDGLVKSYFTEEKVKEIFYDALERGNESDVALAHALIENLEDAVEEIELMVKSIQDNSA